MSFTLLEFVRHFAAIAIGATIGYGFGVLQQAARRKNEQREQAGALKSGWMVMPGSGARIAYLLLTLAVIQLVCPLLFVAGTEWFVSGGLVAGYALTLFTQLRHRMKSNLP